MSEQPSQQIPNQREISERPSWMLDRVEDTPGYGVDGREAYADVADRLQKGRVAVTPVVEVESVTEAVEVPRTLSGQIDIRNSGADWYKDTEYLSDSTWHETPAIGLLPTTQTEDWFK